MAISIPGVILSSLMFEMKNGPGDMVGILLGETLRYSVSAITDAESAGTREERRTCVQEYVIARNIRSFTDTRGRVDFNSLDELVNGRLRNVIGWFRYRCNSSHQLSLMEKTIHRCLMQGLPRNPGRDLIFGLFTEYTPEDPGLHTLEHSFSHWVDSSPKLVHVDVVNLKSTSTMPYRYSPLAPVPSSVSSYYDLLDHSRCGLLTDTGDAVHSIAMEELFKELQLKFDPVQIDLRKSFNTIQSLEDDIDRVKKKLQDLKDVRAAEEKARISPTQQQHQHQQQQQQPVVTITIDENVTNGDVPPLIVFNDDETPSSEQNHHDDNLPNGNNAALDLPLTPSSQRSLGDDEDTISV